MAAIAQKHRRSPSQVTDGCHIFPRWETGMNEWFLQVLLRYHVQQGVAVIPKSDRSHHILENTKVNSPLLSFQSAAGHLGIGTRFPPQI